MASILSLLVHCWVPVSIVEDDITGSCKVEPNSSWSGTTDEAKDSRIIIESLYDSLSELCFCIAVKSYIVELEHIENFLENVKHFSHLSEDQNFLPPVFYGS